MPFSPLVDISRERDRLKAKLDQREQRLAQATTE
jgi:hypothetical protein